MSRIGKAPITLPSGVDVNISGADVGVKGPKGELSHTLPEGIGAELEDGVLTVTRADEERVTRALHGLSRSLVNNMVDHCRRTGCTGYAQGSQDQNVEAHESRRRQVHANHGGDQ